jgi:hypothetical protein
MPALASGSDRLGKAAKNPVEPGLNLDPQAGEEILGFKLLNNAKILGNWGDDGDFWIVFDKLEEAVDDRLENQSAS